jgi:hypothetical protein
MRPRFGLVMLALAAAGCAATTGEPTPSWAVGTWRSTKGESPVVELSFDGHGSGTFESEACRGSFVLAENTSDEAIFSFILESGEPSCTELGTALVRPAPSRALVYDWYEPFDGKRARRILFVPR